MLAILAPPPYFPQKDGYMQRVREIDKLFSNIPRIYIEKTKKWESVGLYHFGENGHVVRLPSGCDEEEFARILAPFISDIYIHSIYQYDTFSTLVQNLALQQKTKVHLDLHGVVPEEMYFSTQNGSEEAKWSAVEKKALETATTCIFVTHSMKDHFQSKYPHNEYRTIILPIFKKDPPQIDQVISKAKIDSYALAPRFIYAGGTQKWQKIDRMIEVIQRSNLTGILLTPDTERFKTLKSQKIAIRTTDPSGVAVELSQSHFSFVLRETSIINKVACPTKLIEAMTYGCLPIIETDDLGDFKDLGFKFISAANFENGDLPSSEVFLENLKTNRKIVDGLYEEGLQNSKSLLSIVNSTAQHTNKLFDEIENFLRLQRGSVMKKILLSREILKPREIYRMIRFMVSKHAL